MFTVMISSESRSFCSELEKYISSNIDDIEIIGTFQNGLEILEHMRHHSVDIVVCDIDYSSRSGISVAKFVHDHKLETKVILLMEQRNFDYAKLCVDYKVHSLIVHPLRPQELINALQSAKEEVGKNLHRAYSEAHGYLLEWDWKRQSLSLVYNGVLSSEFLLRKSRNFFREQTLDMCKCNLVSVQVQNFSSYIKNRWEGKPSSFYEAVSDIGEGETDTYAAFLVANAGNMIEFIVLQDRETSDALSAFVSTLTASLERLYGAVSKIKADSYNSMRELLESKNTMSLINKYLTALSRDNVEKAAKISAEIEKSVSVGNILNIAEQLNDKLINDYDIDICLEEQIEKHGMSKKLITELLNKTESRVSASRYLVVEIKDYIRRNFDSSMTVDSVAQHFSMSASYIGRAFKEETGEKLVEYLMNTKLDRAKELLASGNYTVNEVVHLVGYSQTKYFGVLFKNRVGVTPSEFIRLSRMRD